MLVLNIFSEIHLVSICPIKNLKFFLPFHTFSVHNSILLLLNFLISLSLFPIPFRRQLWQTVHESFDVCWGEVQNKWISSFPGQSLPKDCCRSGKKIATTSRVSAPSGLEICLVLNNKKTFGNQRCGDETYRNYSNHNCFLLFLRK